MSPFSYSRHQLKVVKSMNSLKYIFNYSSPVRNGISRTFSNKESNDELDGSSYTSFMDMIEFKRSQAMRTILVQVQSSQSYRELHTYCSSMGTVEKMFHYTAGMEPMHFILVEFAKMSDVKNILSASTHISENQGVPTYSQFLWFRASNKKLGKLKQSKNVTLMLENSTKMITEEEIRVQLQKCNSISEQMTTLHEITKLNDVGSRLRFLTARQTETMLTGLFPHCCAYPFGSSVNGFGKMGCDLDLVLRLNNEKEKEDSRLIFHCKGSSGSERSMNQRNMEALGDLIHLFSPGCTQVRRILQARVPIIKFYQQLTDIECDLSMTNMSGVCMSDFLYMMGEIDPRVRPLIFTVRKWAKEVGLTYSSPGRWITNFSLTLLVLAFLQKPLNSQPILPSLNTLTRLAGPKDKYITEEGINCTFLRDIKKLKFETKNTESLESLLIEFFEFYSHFDFSTKAICLNEPVALTKPEHNALYIVNPLERGLNVSKNVSVEEVDRFKVEVKNAAWKLESQESRSENWGLLSIFENKYKLPSNANFLLTPRQERLMEVSKLFDEEELDNAKFKNNIVKLEVRQIKKETQEKIKSLEKTKMRRHSKR